MNNLYRHIIITRFNLRFDENCSHCIDEEYLNSRFVLFERYCLPSVQHQTCTDFTWLVLFDEETPECFCEKIATYQVDCKTFTPIFLPLYHNYNDAYREIGLQYAQGVDWLISTRIDNDDAIHAYYVEEIQHFFRTQTFEKVCVASFPDGLQFHEYSKALFHLHQSGNHFISLMEPVKGNIVHTILDFDHTQVKNSIPIIAIPQAQPMWLEIVHGTNIINGFSPYIGASLPRKNQISDEFPINLMPYCRLWKNMFRYCQYYILYRVGQVKKVLGMLLKWTKHL